MAAGCTVTECTIIDPLVKNHLLTTFSSLAILQGLPPDLLIDRLLQCLFTTPLQSTVRLHCSTQYSIDSIIRNIATIVNKTYNERGVSTVQLSLHDIVNDVIVIDNICQKDGSIHPLYNRIIVDQLCGSAVLRGADVFGPGVMASPKGVVKGDIVSVFADVDGNCRKGLAIPYSGRVVFLGNGRLLQDRNDWFKDVLSKGTAVQMTEPMYVCPRLDNLMNELCYPQNIPSTIVGHVLGPLPGETVLDMCASPGGKTSHIAALMNNTGCVVAIDKNHSKISKLLKTLAACSCSCVHCYIYDSTRLASGDEPTLQLPPSPPPYWPESFDRVLLDGPCSGFGQRPLLRYKLKLSDVVSYQRYQRKFIEQAIMLLKRGGTLVYSTCSMLPQENEEQVSWILDNHPEMELTRQDPFIGYPGLMTYGLDETQCTMVQRFGPREFYSLLFKDHVNKTEDNIGFFIAKFIKQ